MVENPKPSWTKRTAKRAARRLGIWTKDLAVPTGVQPSAVDHVAHPTKRKVLARTQGAAGMVEGGGIALATDGLIEGSNTRAVVGGIIYGAAKLVSFGAEQWARGVNRRAIKRELRDKERRASQT